MPPPPLLPPTRPPAAVRLPLALPARPRRACLRSPAVDLRYTWSLLSHMSGARLGEGPCFRGSTPADRHARVHVYSLALIFFLWEKPHYRSGTFQNDMVKNLRDVAVPGTGLSLKWFCYYKSTTLLYLLLLYPLVCFVAALNAWRKRLWRPTEEAPYQPLAAVRTQRVCARVHARHPSRPRPPSLPSSLPPSVPRSTRLSGRPSLPACVHASGWMNNM
jgi:hypothetical protein